MKYNIIMSDRNKDTRIKLSINANNVFDAINIAAEKIDNPEETELIEAIPIFN